MADSSFDPLALVKAMGPQADPTEWAKLYYQDAAKGQQLREEIKNRLLLHESDQKAREREGAANRASHEGIARENRGVQRERITQAGQNFKDRLAAISKDIIWPKGTMSEKEAENAAILKPGEDVGKTHQRITLQGITKVVPIGQMPTRPAWSRGPESIPTTSTTDPYD
jgi:hypothetical protein